MAHHDPQAAQPGILAAPESARLSVRSHLSLAEQLAQRVVHRIKTHVYAPGARLPSVRATAQAQSVSAATVVSAYDRLVAQGWVEAKPQRGFFVRNPPPEGPHSLRNTNSRQNGPSVSGFIDFVATETIAYRQRADLFTASPGSGAAAAVQALAHGSVATVVTASSPALVATATPLPTHAAALVRGMFKPSNRLPQPSMGVLPNEWIDTSFLATALRKVSGSPADRKAWTEYGDPSGDMQLRQALSQRLQACAVHAAPQHIITTLGATHALDIASRALLLPGQAVMVEEPGWTVEFARLSAMGMRLLPVPRTAAGPCMATMRRYCQAAQPQDRPKLFVSVSVLHNPTGVSLSPSAAHLVLQMAHEFGFYVLEDDTYAHFAPDHATRLAALDCAPELQRVVYIGGFAKALAPNWRIGFMAAPAHLVERMTDTKMLSTLTTPSMLERALAHVINQGQLRRHSERLKNQLAAARSRSVKLALAHGCTLAAKPAGLFGWVDVGTDTDTLAPKLLDLGYLIAPGSLFYAERRPTTLMRINFSTTQTPDFWQSLSACR